MIDLIIPIYNSKTIDDTLASIAYQTDTDIHVYIVDDASDTDYEDIIKFYKNFLNITYLRLEKNKGPGIARQYGIDHSDSPYLMFMDGDDSLGSPEVIERFKQLTYSNNEIIVSTFVEEIYDGSLIFHTKDETWMHGKLYLRDYIDRNRIHFNDTRKNEDNFFNQLVFLHNPRVYYLDEPTYIYRNNLDSTTRMNNYEYGFSGDVTFAYNIADAIREASMDKCSKLLISSLGYRALLSIYFASERWRDKDISELLTYARRIYKYTDLNVLSEEFKEEQKNNSFKSMWKKNPDLMNHLSKTLEEFYEMLGDKK